MSASIAASWSSPSIATVAPWSAATARSVSAKATSGWNAPICVPAAIAGREDLRTEGAAGMDHRLAAVQPERAGQGGHDVVRDGEDHQLDLVEDWLRIGEDPVDVDQRAEPLAPRGVATGDRVDRPARARQGDAERSADRAGADDADDRRLTGGRVLVRVDVVGGLAIGVTVRAGDGRVEVDARLGDGLLHLRPIALRVVAGEAAPGLHRGGPERVGEGRRGFTHRV